VRRLAIACAGGVFCTCAAAGGVLLAIALVGGVTLDSVDDWWRGR